MTAFAWVMVALFVAFLAGIVLLGLRSPRSGADVLGWRPTRSPETEAANEVDDVDQMLEAANRLRRRRGAARAHARGRRGLRPRGRVARVLIVGCGCRGQALAADLRAAGHAVRGTTRDPARAAAIAAAGAEPYVGDPDRIGTLMEALAGVTVVCWLMGTATGTPEQVAALHDGRLRMLWEKLVDTPVRGVVHEAAGPLPVDVLARGRAVAEVSSETWRIPLAVVETDPLDHAAWRSAAGSAVAQLLS